MTSRPTVLASIVLALALLGDSLLYVVLPLHASTFGVSLALTGVLLSVNRIVRLFAYPLLPRLAATGLRRLTVAAAVLGALSTFVFAFGRGAWVLLASRLVWGIVFGALSLSTLVYATQRSEVAGKRVGLSLSLRELGPLLSLTIGTTAVAHLGVRPTLTVLGLASLAGIFFAMRLPSLKIDTAGSGMSLRLPRNAEWQSFAAGFVADGIFPATVALLLLPSIVLPGDPGTAVVGAGLLLGLKRVAVVVLAPAGGHAADRFGAGLVTAAGLSLAAIGAVTIALGGVVGGGVLLSCGAALTTTSIPVSVPSHDRLRALAGIGMARDAGAAAGPLIALALFDVAGATVIYSAAGAVLAALALRLFASSCPLYVEVTRRF